MKKPAAPSGPPSFRTAVHRPIDQSDPKRPPRFETAYLETSLNRPGVMVHASDRTYVTTPDGSIRRLELTRTEFVVPRTPQAPSRTDRERAITRERIERALDRQDERRMKRQQAASRRKQVAR